MILTTLNILKYRHNIIMSAEIPKFDTMPGWKCKKGNNATYNKYKKMWCIKYISNVFEPYLPMVSGTKLITPIETTIAKKYAKILYKSPVILEESCSI